ncbi:HEAT repeat domain-containing protein [Synechococcus sp. CS-1328]|uniref:HEAT repeat domain-containing protein n=1 Tax=Synechococcus sp. CS-1328 TaxID=2847976 RepID=UPI00223BC223|nr:HEAT repeat domain-containing protein [Synechococcus sp. CS-1328]MCT0225363.1 HEAT repeat domain-containing protein [Synechococcus sp. CS-1328]
MTLPASTTGETADLQLTQELIERVEQASTALELLQATQALAAAAHPAAAPCLVDVLGFNNPGAAVAAVDGLIALGNQAVEAILTNLDGYNYGARAWAVRALAGIGDVRGLEVLEDALAQDIGPSVRRAAARGLGQLKMQELAEAPRAALVQRCLGALEASCGDGEWVVRYAVVVGLESLAAELSPTAELRPRLRQALEGLRESHLEATAVVRLRAEQAIHRLEAQHG